MPGPRVEPYRGFSRSKELNSIAYDANTTAAEHREMTAKSHRAAASYHEKADATGEHKHCAEGVKHSGMAHKVWVAVRRADSKMKM